MQDVGLVKLSIKCKPEKYFSNKIRNLIIEKGAKRRSFGLRNEN